MVAELFNDWGRADEILKSSPPFDATKLCETIRINNIDGVTGEVSNAIGIPLTLMTGGTVSLPLWPLL